MHNKSNDERAEKFSQAIESRSSRTQMAIILCRYRDKWKCCNNVSRETNVFLICAMTEPERHINTFYAFCSLCIPGMGQLLQKRPGAAIGFFAFFILTGLLPISIIFYFTDDQLFLSLKSRPLATLPIWCGLVFPFMLAFFFSTLDAATWEKENRTRFVKPMITLAILYSLAVLSQIFFPPLWTPHYVSERVRCTNQMKQIILAIHEYHDEH